CSHTLCSLVVEPAVGCRGGATPDAGSRGGNALQSSSPDARPVTLTSGPWRGEEFSSPKIYVHRNGDTSSDSGDELSVCLHPAPGLVVPGSGTSMPARGTRAASRLLDRQRGQEAGPEQPALMLENHSYEADAASTTSKDSTAPLRSRLTDKEQMNRAKFSTQQHPNHTDRHKTQHRREPSVISQASLAFLSITKSFIKARSRSRVLLHNISRRAQQLPGPWGVVQARKEAARKLTERRRAEEEERDSLQHNPSNTSLATRCPTFATVTDHASPPLLPTASGFPHHSTSAPPTHRSLCPPPSQPAPPPLHPLYPTPSLNPHTPSPGATNPGCSQNTAHPLIRPRTAHPPPQRLSSTSQLSPPPDTLLPRGPPMTAAGREEGEGLLLRRSSSLNHLDPPLSWVAPGQLQPPSPSSATPAAGLPAPVRSHLGRAVGSAPGYVLLPQLLPLAVEVPGERGRGGVASNLAATPCQLAASPGTGLTPRPPHPSSAHPAGVQPAATMTLGLPPGLVWAPEALRGPAAPLAAVLPPGPPLCRPLRAAFAPSPAHSPSSAHSPDPFTPRTRGLAEVSQARRKPPLRPSTSNRVSPSQQPNHWRQGLLTAIASSNISAESSSGVLGSSVIARPDELVTAGLQGRLHAHTMHANPVRSLPGSHRTTRNGSIAIWGAGFPEQHTTEHDPVAAAQAWVQTSGQRAAVEEVPRTYNRVCSSGWSERKSAQRHGENERPRRLKRSKPRRCPSAKPSN
ncbi:hypothetical protein QJQ45_022247, partial [Haematococcus lacustris]